MANTNRERIVNSLVSTIALVNGSAPYSTRVQKVERRDRAAQDIPTQDMPWVGVEEGQEPYEGRLGFYRCEFPVELTLQVQAGTEQAARELVHDLWDDIYHSINNIVPPNPDSYTRGGAAYDTFIVTVDKAEIFDRNVARMTVELKCRYVRNFQNN